MTDSNFNSEPAIFKELPKEQQKALRKEFDATTKAGRNLIIVSVIFALAMLAFAFGGIFSEDWIIFGCIFPACFFTVFVATYEEKFSKWLKSEKNIIMKKKKVKT